MKISFPRPKWSCASGSQVILLDAFTGRYVHVACSAFEAGGVIKNRKHELPGSLWACFLRKVSNNEALGCCFLVFETIFFVNRFNLICEFLVHFGWEC